MNITVAVASRHGSTREIAQAIANSLEHAGHAVTLAEASDVAAINDADAVVLGSAVYEGRWLTGARAFGRRFSDALENIPVWLFSSGMTESTQAGPEGNPPPVDATLLAGVIGAQDQAVFGGKIDRENLGPIERVLVSVVHAHDNDARDWKAIEAFAAGIAEYLATDGARGTAAERSEDARV